jgi:plasmid stabilization system protein ParE
VTRIELVPGIQEDFDRIIDHLLDNAVASAENRIEEIICALDILQQNPLIGRPVNSEMRELVIGRDTHCYIALYSYIELIDTVFVLAIRHAREAGYAREWLT